MGKKVTEKERKKTWKKKNNASFGQNSLLRQFCKMLSQSLDTERAATSETSSESLLIDTEKNDGGRTRPAMIEPIIQLTETF